MVKRGLSQSNDAKVDLSGGEYFDRVKGSADKWEALNARTRRGGITWADAGAEDLRDMVAAVTADGSAVLLATTSDGGALVIQVLNGKGRHKLYPADDAELAEALSLVTRVASS